MRSAASRFTLEQEQQPCNGLLLKVEVAELSPIITPPRLLRELLYTCFIFNKKTCIILSSLVLQLLVPVVQQPLGTMSLLV